MTLTLDAKMEQVRSKALDSGSPEQGLKEGKPTYSNSITRSKRRRPCSSMIIRSVLKRLLSHCLSPASCALTILIEDWSEVLL